MLLLDRKIEAIFATIRTDVFFLKFFLEIKEKSILQNKYHHKLPQDSLVY